MEKTKAELAWLEQQKQRIRNKGADDNYPQIVKRQRGLKMKLQEQQVEILPQFILDLLELQCEKTYLLTCASNKDSNQPAHLHSLIRVFIICMKKLCIIGYPKYAQ